MDTVVETTINQTSHDELAIANIWKRLGAYLIDVVFIYAINGIILSPIKFMSDQIPMTWGYWTTIGTLGVIVYYLYFCLATKIFSKTIGKFIFGIKVVSINEAAPTWGDIFFREFIGRLLHNVLFFMKLLYIYVLVSENKQGFHDVIGRTLVVNDRKPVKEG